MTYSVRFTETAEENLARLAKSDAAVAQRILDKIKWLAAHCTLVHHEPLSGDLTGFCRKRVGDYRVVYILDADAQSIEVCMIGHRKDIYKV